MTTSEEHKPLHIVSLEVENVKRIRAVEIDPDGNVVIIGGRNEQGKSSILDAIEMALRGAKAIPIEPVRHGARKGFIKEELGNLATQEVEYTVERTFTAKGSQLVVRGKDGVPVPGPQTLLDSLYAAIAFDPFSFARKEPKEQDELLRKAVGLDLSDLKSARDVAYAKRTDGNKEIKRLEGALDSTEFHPGAPKETVDVAALTEKLQVHRNAVGARNALVAAIDGKRARLNEKQDQVSRIQRQLTDLLRECTELGDLITSEEAKLPPEPAPIDDVQEKLRTAEATNTKVRANAEHAKLEKELKTKTDEAEQLTGVIEDLDKQKAERLAATKFPIDGLGFDDEIGPTLNGVPLAQACQSAKLRLSVAIGAALNPRIKVMLIREGAFLDDESLKLLSALAKEHQCQLFIERVGTKDKSAIVIEDGAVLEAPAEATAGAA